MGQGAGSVQVTALGRRVSLTVKQVLAALLEQAADVEWDEQLGSERVAVQVTGQSKGPLQNRHQQKATGGGLAMPTLDLVGSTETQSFLLCTTFFFSYTKQHGRILAFQTRDQTRAPLQWKYRVLTTGLAREIPHMLTLF